MTYTVNDIELDQFWYADRSLAVFYFIKDDLHKKGLLLPESSLSQALKEIGLVKDYNVNTAEVRLGNMAPYITLTNYMENYLDEELAEKLVINYLNNKTSKP
ncbi:hypothetical protein F0L74_09915 [Chitinophaga agrisoli]|uniref:Uncharacterized protein n=1 Tax=Chitinophaga agrisoli TaxID=2607653 RepID=A0A5B2VUT7_9BACT|nr:hypothetical protein [Chitinophaga agrisoli]KAA2242835.1 hypothetical protein F0L74_09915 [Chitinophaga agrisoli]